jgi:hypothetical protein
MKSLYKVEIRESNSPMTLQDKLNSCLNQWRHSEKEVEVSVNKETGAYYFVLKIYN